MYSRALDGIPPMLLEALTVSGMVNPCLLRSYPRTSAEKLGLVPLVVFEPGESGAHTPLLSTTNSTIAYGAGTDITDISIASSTAAVAAVSSFPSSSASVSVPAYFSGSWCFFLWPLGQ